MNVGYVLQCKAESGVIGNGSGEMDTSDSDEHNDTSGKEHDADIAGESCRGLNSEFQMHLFLVGG